MENTLNEILNQLKLLNKHKINKCCYNSQYICRYCNNSKCKMHLLVVTDTRYGQIEPYFNYGFCSECIDKLNSETNVQLCVKPKTNFYRE